MKKIAVRYFFFTTNEVFISDIHIINHEHILLILKVYAFIHCTYKGEIKLRIFIFQISVLCILRNAYQIRYSVPSCTNSNEEGYCCIRFDQDLKLKQKWVDAARIPDGKPSKSVILRYTALVSKRAYKCFIL